MTAPVSVSVPGKLFVLGEYAVLAGGPALVASPGTQVHVRVRDDDAGYEVVGASIDDRLRLPSLVHRVLKDREGIQSSSDRITVDVGDFYIDDTKLGLGSSASSTVGLIAAAAPQLGAKRRFELAVEVHRKLQGGLGSGADIAASTFGTPLAYHLNDPPPPFDALDFPGLTEPRDPLVTDSATIERSLSFPEPLRIDAVWTGTSAKSTDFVDGLTEALKTNRQEVEAVLKSIASRARVGIHALRDGEAERFVDAIRKGDRAMERLGDITRLPIITDTHRRIRALSHTTQAVAKPSGAGGGDFTLLVSPRDAELPRPIRDDFLVLPVHP